MRKSTLLFAAILLLFTSCQRGCQRLEKKYQMSDRTYEVKVYSGGETVFKDRFTGIANDTEGGDGMYYIKGDTLIEVSGDYILKSVN